MAKRKDFRVWLNISAPPHDDHAIDVGIKHAFNSAAAAGQKALAQWAVANGLPGEWRKDGSGITKVDHEAVRGFRLWTHVATGRSVRIEIELLNKEG